MPSLFCFFRKAPYISGFLGRRRRHRTAQYQTGRMYIETEVITVQQTVGIHDFPSGNTTVQSTQTTLQAIVGIQDFPSRSSY